MGQKKNCIGEELVSLALIAVRALKHHSVKVSMWKGVNLAEDLRIWMIHLVASSML